MSNENKQAAERAAFERCAQICEKWAQSIDTGKKRNRVVAAAIQGALTCAAAIRATAPQATPHPEYTRGWQDCLSMHISPQASVKGDERRPAKSHCQNGGDVCLAGNRDGVCCPEDSCDIDDGIRAAVPQATMPKLTDAMRAVLRNEHCIYGSEDDLYAALCNAVGPEQRTEQRMSDAAISACALMIKGICMTLPQDQWSSKIEERIRFMLSSQAEK